MIYILTLMAVGAAGLLAATGDLLWGVTSGGLLVMAMSLSVIRGFRG